jgi:dihydrofolate reductase
MRNLFLTENITADGRIEMLDDWFDPGRSGEDVADLQQEMDRQGRDCDAMLLGRQTFEDFRSYWPQHTDTLAGAYLDQVQKYVVSSSMTDPAWTKSTVLSGDAPVEEVRRLKESDGGSILVTGSITLTHALLSAGLVDEIRLFVYPAIQGRGRGLVAEGTRLPQLQLMEAKPFRSGVALLRYAVAVA